MIVDEQDEVYYGLESNEIILPEVVVSRCTVFGKSQLLKSIKRSLTQKRNAGQQNPAHCSDDESDNEEEEDREEAFSCNLAVDSYRGLFYDFHWDAHRKSVLSLTKLPLITDDNEEDTSWGSGIPWNVEIKESKRRSTGRKRKPEEESDDDIESKDEYQASEDEKDEEEQEEQEEDVAMTLQTPSKKYARRDPSGASSPHKSTTATPRKRPAAVKPLAQPTPHSKKAAAARGRKSGTQLSPSKKKQKFTIRPRAFPCINWNNSQSNSGSKDPWLRAMHMLHVGNRPDSLPCRDTEFDNVLRCVGELLEEGSGGCVCRCTILITSGAEEG